MVHSSLWECFHHAFPNLSWFVLQSWKSLFVILLFALSHQTGFSWSPRQSYQTIIHVIPPPDLLFVSFMLNECENWAPPGGKPGRDTWIPLREKWGIYFPLFLASLLPLPQLFPLPLHTPWQEKPNIPLPDWGRHQGLRTTAAEQELPPAATAVRLFHSSVGRWANFCSWAALAVCSHTHTDGGWTVSGR